MTALQQLQSLLKEVYTDEDGYEHMIEPMPALTTEQIDAFTAKLPASYLPADIKELLQFAGGFEFNTLDDVTFTAIDEFGFENIFPHSIQLAHDGFGNFWVLDIDSIGHWGAVYYVCHDPAVVVKHSNNLAEFISHVAEFGRDGERSNLDVIHEKTVHDIWNNNPGFIDHAAAAASADAVLKKFAATLPANSFIADLRNKPNKTGFAWGKYNREWHKAVRYGNELLWAVEIPAKKGFLSRLFGK